MPYTKKTVLERVQELCIPEPNTGCWIWVGAIQNRGYGSIHFGGKTVSAHKISYLAHGNIIPPGLELDHKCHQRLCVNPNHLECVTHRINLQRKCSKILACPKGHLYTAENLRASKRGFRLCKTCHREKARERAACR